MARRLPNIDEVRAEWERAKRNQRVLGDASLSGTAPRARRLVRVGGVAVAAVGVGCLLATVLTYRSTRRVSRIVFGGIVCLPIGVVMVVSGRNVLAGIGSPNNAALGAANSEDPGDCFSSECPACGAMARWTGEVAGGDDDPERAAVLRCRCGNTFEETGGDVDAFFDGLLGERIDWIGTGDVERPWSALWHGIVVTLELGDFPAEHLYRVLRGDSVLTEVSDWPPTWIKRYPKD